MNQNNLSKTDTNLNGVGGQKAAPNKGAFSLKQAFGEADNALQRNGSTYSVVKSVKFKDHVDDEGRGTIGKM